MKLPEDYCSFLLSRGGGEGFLEEQYTKLANRTNKVIREDYNLVGTWTEIQEIKPIKFGGSPTDHNDKILLDPPSHWKVSEWWKQLQKGIEGQ